MKCDGTRVETRFRFSAKRTSPFKSAGASVQSTTGSRGVRIGGSNAGYTIFRGSVKSNGYPLHSPVSPSFPLPCVTVCHHILTGLYLKKGEEREDHSTKRRKANSTGRFLPRDCFLKNVNEGKKLREDEDEGVSNYWMTLKGKKILEIETGSTKSHCVEN